MPIKGLTQAQIDEATRAVVTAGGKSTDRNNRLPGETGTEANARITAAYKELTAKPVLTPEQIDGGMKVQFVRTSAGGAGEYVATKPLNYTGPTKIEEFTNGIVPEGAKYTTGTAVGLDTGGRTVDEFRKILVGKKVAGNPLTAKEQEWLDANLGSISNPAPASTVTAVTPEPVATAKKFTPQELNAIVTKMTNGVLLTPEEAAAVGVSDSKSIIQTNVTPAVTPKKFTPAELQDIIRRMTNGEKLTAEEAAAVGVSNPGSIVPTGPTLTAPVGPTLTAPVGPTLTAPVGPTLTAPVGPTLTAPVGPTLTGSTGPSAAELLAAQNQAAIDAAEKRDRQSAYDTLYNEFNKYGLGSLVEGIKGLIQSNLPTSQFSLELQNTPEYQKRFAANKDRIAKGLSALSPADYISKEDAYQRIMANYELPNSYYAKDSMGTQVGFQKLIANDVSDTELEYRIGTAKQRVINANPEVLQALKQFYPDINNGDILAYVLDPTNAKDMINRKVTAAEIGGAQIGAGLKTSEAYADALRAGGVTKAQYEANAPTIAEATQRGLQLADIYGQSPYTQQTAEAEYLNLSGGAQATAKRKKLKSLEEASFSGSSGVGALGRDKALYGGMQGQQGLY